MTAPTFTDLDKTIPSNTHQRHLLNFEGIGSKFADAIREVLCQAGHPAQANDGLKVWEYIGRCRSLPVSETHHMAAPMYSTNQSWGDFAELYALVKGQSAPPPNLTLQPLGLDKGGFTCGTQRVNPLVCHHGSALWLHKNRPDESRNQLDRIKAQGYDGIRIFLTLGWYPYWRTREVAPIDFDAQDGVRVQGWSAYFEWVERLLRSCAARGLYVNPAFGDMQMFPGLDARVKFASKLGKAISGWGLSTSVGYVQWNEADLNGASGPEEVEEVVSACADEIGCLRSGTGTRSETADEINAWNGAWADHWVEHGYRGGRPHDRIRHVFSLHYEQYVRPGEHGKMMHEYGWQSEPIGDGSSVGSTTNVEELCLLACMAQCMKQAWTFMSGDGVLWKSPIDTRAGFAEVPRAIRAIVPLDINTFQHRFHGGSTWGHNRILAANDTQEVRCDHVLNGSDNRFVVVIYGPGPQRMKVRVDRSFKGRLWNPATAESQSCQRQAGDELAFDATVGRVLVGSLT